MAKFNRTILGKNIKYLAAQKGTKLGDLEHQVEVSTGYFSRLLNDDGKSSSSLMDIICKVADNLETSVNTLISTDLCSLTPNEFLLSKFFDKLSKTTASGQLVWELETGTKLEKCTISGGNPLFRQVNSNDFGSTFFYNSSFDSDITTAGDMYRAVVNNKWIYFYKVKKQNNPVIGFELYFINENCYEESVEPICNAYPDSNLFNQVLDLYNAASESSRHVKLSESVIETINVFLNDKEIDPDDIPF